MVNRSFTLVEMLVVISIIAILASLLMPAMMRALDSGRTTVCGNNERMVWIAVSAYAEGNNSRLPPLYATPSWKKPYIPQYLAASGLGPSSNVNDYDIFNSFGVDTQWNIRDKTALGKCAAVGSSGARAQTHHQLGDYGFNWAHVTWALGFSLRISQFSKPSTRMLCGDAEENGATTWGLQCASHGTCAIDPRHNGGMQLLYMDGHVAWMHEMDVLANKGDVWNHVDAMVPGYGPNVWNDH